MKIAAIMKRIFRQFRRDKRSLALMIVAPVFVVTLLWLVLDTGEYEPSIAVIGVPAAMAAAMEEAGAHIFETDIEEAGRALRNREIDAYIRFDRQNPQVMLEGSNPSANSAVLRVLLRAAQDMNPLPVRPELHYLHGSEELNLFDRIGPVLIGLFTFFFVFLLGGVSFLRERTQGTLERLLAAPLKRWELVLGYLCGFGLLTVLQSVIIVTYCIYALDMYMAGSILYVLMVTFLLAMTALSLGTMLSAFAKNEFQMIQFIPLVIVPQVFFSGVFPLENMEPWLSGIGKIMPLTYGAEALQQIMIRGQGFSAVQSQVYVLIGFSLAFAVLNTIALKRHRKL